MSDQNDCGYYTAQANASFAMASAAKDERASEIHLTMAALYKELAALADDRKRPNLRVIAD